MKIVSEMKISLKSIEFILYESYRNKKAHVRFFLFL